MINTLPLKDPSKPEGEACNADGTLKDAKQIAWVHSLSDLPPPPFENPNKHSLDDEFNNNHIAKQC